jgi:glutathione S-transferase
MRSPSEDAPFRLITIPISHYCEKARWAMDRLGIPFEEEGHAPAFHVRATAKAGGRSTPVLVTRAGIFKDSTDILKYLDSFAPPGEELYPPDPALGREVDDLEECFDHDLGPSTRLWGYFHLLPRRDLMLPVFRAGVPEWQASTLVVVYPVVRFLMRRAMNITAPRAVEALERIGRIFDEVECRLSDGRSFLVGERFTAADLTFAVLSYPMVFPSECQSPGPSLEEAPAALLDVIRSFRARPGGAFVQRIFRDLRHAKLHTPDIQRAQS